jgi:hypothetical protein
MIFGSTLEISQASVLCQLKAIKQARNIFSLPFILYYLVV